MLECIYCSSKKITKSIMAPMISNSKNNDELINNNFKSEKKKLIELRKNIEKNFDYVSLQIVRW